MGAGGVGLEGQLMAATVAITVPDRGQADLGSGAFVAPGLVITCGHVVADQAGTPRVESVRGSWQGRELDLRVVPEWIRPWADGKGPDLALLRVVGEDYPETPWVELRDVVDIGDDLWAYGYPKGPYRSGDSVAFRYEGPSRSAGSVLHKLSQGQAQPGLSGAPVLNRRTGGVVGLVRASRDSSSDLGARLVTATLIAAEYGPILAAELGSLVDRPWLDALTDEQLVAGRWERPSPKLFDYLQAAEKQAREFPYAVPVHIAPPLIDLYVEQKVTSKAAERREPDKHDEHDKQRDRERKLEAVLATKLLTQHRNAVLTGGPGAGKSSLFNFIVADSARKWLRPAPGEASPDFVPARLSATRLAETPGPLASAVATVLSQDLVDYLKEPLPAYALHQAPMPGVDWLVLVDGIDEVLDPESRRKLLARLSHAMGEDSCLRIAIASRPLTEQELGFAATGDAVYELQPFDPEEMLAFADKLFDKHGSADSSADAQRFVDQLSGSSLYELCRTPLLATMTWAMYVDYPERPLPGGRTQLYREFVDKLLHEQDRKLKVTDQLRDMLRECPGAENVVAGLIGDRKHLIASVAADRHEGSEHSLLDLALGYLAARKPADGITDNRWRELVRDLLIRTGLVGRKGRELVFTHHTFQEYFTAVRTAAMHTPSDEEGRLVLERGISSNQQNVTLFLAGVWALQGADLSEAIIWLLRRGDMQVNLAAAIVADGVRVSADCAEDLVTSLGIMKRSRPAGGKHETFKKVAPHLDDDLLHRIAAAEHINPLVRVIVVLTINRRAGENDVLPELRLVVQDLGASPGLLLTTVDLLDEHGFRSSALTLLRSESSATSPPYELEVAQRLYRLGEAAQATEIILDVLTGAEHSVDRMLRAADMLARHDSTLGIEHLLQISTSSTLSAFHRYRCADALGTAGAVDEAHALLHQVLRDPTADRLDFSWAAESLARLGFRREAIAALSEAALDPRTTAEFRLRVIVQLRELDALGIDLVPVLAAIRDNPTVDTAERIDAVTMLSFVDGSVEPVDELLRLARLPGRLINPAVVADKLLELKAPAAAKKLLREVLENADVSSMSDAAMILVDLELLDEATAPLRAVVHDRHQSIHDRCYALYSLRRFRADASDLDAITTVAESPALPVSVRLTAVQRLAGLPDNQWAVDQLRHWAYSRDLTVDQRLDAARALAQFDHGNRRTVARLQYLTHPDLPLADAMEVLESTPHETWGDTVHQAVIALNGRSTVPARWRHSVRNILMSTLSPAEQLAAHRAVALDTAQPANARLQACRWLYDEFDRTELADVVLDVIERSDTSPADLVTAAGLLVRYGRPEHCAEVLRQVAADESTPPAEKLEASEALLRLSEFDAALGGWREVLAAREWADGAYSGAARNLASVGLVDEAVGALHAFIELVEKPSADRADAAAHLSLLGRHEEAVTVLDELAAAARSTADAVAVAAALERIDEWRRANDLCAGVVLAADARESDRLDATTLMCRRGATGAYEANRRAVEAGVRPRCWARSWAVLAEYGYEREAAERLRDVAYDGTQAVDDRIACAIALADSGSWLGEAVSLVRAILREQQPGAREVIAVGEFLSGAGEWSEAIALLDTLDVEALDEELTERLNQVPVRTLFHR
ncbi:hypothetical protein ALI22I_11500 [Saccharothrix sp. ALI-22-I]|uniref:serine protease n=1 Tax=Saccharothrix sp. ALI-22-I TaxID=1933778 RepID=UPI00097C3379|nr:serine protease [Saccharothrix sp. ALI-22-I]ONI90723.1 hypothetical protein ALI22I_11500 [Saccharothrix sp. ALI-22-I]